MSATLFLTIIALLPAADGSLSLRFTSGSTIPSRPHPDAPGTANALSTLVAPDKIRTDSPSRLGTPMLPEIGLFGGGGLVVPVVRLSLDGLLFVTDVAVRTEYGFSSFTLTGSLIVVTGIPISIATAVVGPAS